MKFILSAGIFGVLLSVMSGCTAMPNVQERASALQIDPNTYIAQVGDTVESVSYRYQLASGSLQALNPGLGQLRPGDRINIRPADGEKSARAAGAHTSEVQANYKPSKQNNGASQRYDIRTQSRAGSTVSGNSGVQRNSTEQVQPEVIVSAIPSRAKPIQEGAIIEEVVSEYSVSSVVEIPKPDSAAESLSRNGWQWPSVGEVVRDYAPQEINGQGVDIAGVPGQQIKAAAAGTVIYAGRDLSDSGNLVIIRHSEDVLSTYSHVKDLYVAEDDKVGAGDPLATLGWNSNRESVLHFGIRKEGKPVNPIGYLPNR